MLRNLRNFGFGRRFFADGHFWVDQRRFVLRNLRNFGFGSRNKLFDHMFQGGSSLAGTAGLNRGDLC
ncbi:hypothetical protein J6590_060556 [Homalodisca vitripennis]|nr:hypothetical protein J6590_060556 [Homalodisca vitripennis]